MRLRITIGRDDVELEAGTGQKDIAVRVFLQLYKMSFSTMFCLCVV